MKPILIKDYNTDKSSMPDYLHNYETIFSDLADQEITLLELGVKNGGSVYMWRDYFEKGRIIGLDINKVVLDDSTGRTKFYQGSQSDLNLLRTVALENAPNGFDIIIDDCAHVGKHAKASFWYLFTHHLKNGGIYVIEDWGTGYWKNWPDGKSYKKADDSSPHPFKTMLNKIMNKKNRFPSHEYGMVGFIKELIDECGMADITNQQFGIPPFRPSAIKRMQVSPGIVFVFKA